MQKSYFRGWPIIWLGDKQQWVYENDLSSLPANGGQIRPCRKCGRIFSLENHDPCLGILPGVRQACCGHGVEEQSFISFNNGLIIEGFKISQERIK
jgi:hypothetical protein